MITDSLYFLDQIVIRVQFNFEARHGSFWKHHRCQAVSEKSSNPQPDDQQLSIMPCPKDGIYNFVERCRLLCRLIHSRSIDATSVRSPLPWKHSTKVPGKLQGSQRSWQWNRKSLQHQRPPQLPMRDRKLLLLRQSPVKRGKVSRSRYPEMPNLRGPLRPMDGQDSQAGRTRGWWENNDRVQHLFLHHEPCRKSQLFCSRCLKDGTSLGSKPWTSQSCRVQFWWRQRRKRDSYQSLVNSDFPKFHFKCPNSESNLLDQPEYYLVILRVNKIISMGGMMLFFN